MSRGTAMASKQKPLPNATAADAEVTPTDVELAKDAYRAAAVPAFRRLLDADLVKDEEENLTVA